MTDTTIIKTRNGNEMPIRIGFDISENCLKMYWINMPTRSGMKEKHMY